MASFVVCNANGLHNTLLFPDKPRRFLQHLRNSSADFSFVSETHFTPTDNPWALIPNAIFSSYNHKQRGCALVPLRPGVRFTNTRTDDEGRWITTTVHTPYFPPLRVCGIYAPNSGHHEFVKMVLETATDCEHIFGDFNFTTRYGDRSPSSPLDSGAIACLDALSTAGFTDLAPTNSPHNFTHRNGRYTARLYRCYSRPSPHFNRYFSTLHRFPTSHKNLSDHITIIHLISPEPIPRGSPFWRLNQQRLSESNIAALTHSLARFAPLSPLSLLDKWEEIKHLIREHFSYRPRPPRSGLTAEFPGDHSVMPPQRSDPLKVQYEKRLLLGRIAADRARELPSPLLSKLIDDNITENHIPGVVIPDGNISVIQAEISSSFHSHFSSVYSAKPSSPSHLTRNIPTLPLPLISSLSNPILVSDILTASARTNKNSAPGPDGIPYSLYAQCPLLQILLVKVIQAAISTGRFPESWSHTLVRPILKPGKNPFLPASCRPIALLCTDYKIFTTIVSSRMKPFLAEHFPQHQTGYISGRSTHHAALRFAHLLSSTEDSFPLLLDSEKAYDRVSHEWLETCLIKSGFPVPLATLILNILHSSSGRIITNNRLSLSSKCNPEYDKEIH